MNSLFFVSIGTIIIGVFIFSLIWFNAIPINPWINVAIGFCAFAIIFAIIIEAIDRSTRRNPPQGS